MVCCKGCGRDTSARHGYCGYCSGGGSGKGFGKSKGRKQLSVGICEFLTHLETCSDEMNIRKYEKIGETLT